MVSWKNLLVLVISTEFFQKCEKQSYSTRMKIWNALGRSFYLYIYFLIRNFQKISYIWCCLDYLFINLKAQYYYTKREAHFTQQLCEHYMRHLENWKPGPKGKFLHSAKYTKDAEKSADSLIWLRQTLQALVKQSSVYFKCIHMATILRTSMATPPKCLRWPIKYFLSSYSAFISLKLQSFGIILRSSSVPYILSFLYIPFLSPHKIFSFPPCDDTYDQTYTTTKILQLTERLCLFFEWYF